MTYTAPFTYTVRLTVTDSKGKTATTTQDMTIAP
jgi:PKD repeat protein